MNNIVFDKQFKEPQTPYNIVSVCVFVMKKGYKTNEIYSNGLQYTIQNINKFLPDFFLRIYYDSSIELDDKFVKIIKDAKKNKKIQLVKFHHPWFIGDNGYHLGTFGTIVRLFPLFSNDEPNLKTVFITDIDYNEGMLPFWRETYNNFKNSKSQVHMFARECNHLNERVKNIVQYLDLNISPFLNFFWSKIRYPSNILDTFLKCLHNEHNANINAKNDCQEIQIFSKTDFSIVKKANKMDKQKMMYGIDEVCLLMIVKYIINQKIPYSYHIFPDLLIPFRDAYAINSKLVNTQEHKDLIMKMMGSYYNNKKTSQQNFNAMYLLLNTYDSYLFPLTGTKLKMFVNLTNRVKHAYKTILYKDYQKFNLNEDTVKCVLNSTLNGLKVVNYTK
jgi:hypothetical protein